MSEAFPLAEPSRRIHARTIESVIPALGMGISIGGALRGSGEIVRAGGAVFVVATALVLAINAVLLWLHGQTIGKRLLGLRVVRPDGALPGGMRAFVVRELVVGLVSLVPGLGAVVALVDAGMLLWNAERRTLHDVLADTIVIDERANIAVPAASAPRAHASERGTRARRR